MDTLYGIAAQNARKTHCKRGHPFDADNTGIRRLANGKQQRFCRTCFRAHDRAYRARNLDRERERCREKERRRRAARRAAK